MSTVVASVLMKERRSCSPAQIASTARRNLFGPIDHEQTSRTLQRELARISREKTKLWNFHFKSGKPLTGRYQWIPVNAAASDTRDIKSQTTPPAPANSPSSSTAASTTSSSSVVKQTAITDYMRQRKRLSSTTETVSTKKSKAS